MLDVADMAALLGTEAFVDLLAVAGYEQLTTLSFIEPLSGRGYSVHERSRRVLRARLRQDAPQRFEALTERAWRYFSEQDDPGWIIERIYHLLLVDPQQGSDQLNALAWRWQNASDPSINRIEVLINAAREHVEAGALSEQGVVWVSYWDAHLDVAYERYKPARQKLAQLIASAPDDPLLRARS